MAAPLISRSDIRDGPAPAPPPGYMTLTVVGSGVSTGVPVIGHFGLGCACEHAVADPKGPNNRNNISLLLTLPRRDLPEISKTSSGVTETRSEEKYHMKESEADAEVSEGKKKATGPSHSRFDTEKSGNYVGGKPVAHILIDSGKTFRDAYFKVMIKCNIRTVDTLLLTHGHADAVAGLDDLRDLQTMHMISTGDWVIDSFIPTYLSLSTFKTLEKSVDYIIRNSVKSGPAAATAAEHAAQQAACLQQRASLAATKEAGWRNIGIRRSTALDLFLMDETKPSRMHLPITSKVATAAAPPGTTVENGNCEDIPFYSFPVEHGKGYISMAWVFGRGTAFKSHPSPSPEALHGSCVVYISDVSDIPAVSMAFLQDLVRIDVLYVDCLSPAGRTSPVHYCEDDMMALVTILKPRYVFGVGMYCALEHTVWVEELQKALDSCIASGQLRTGEVECLELAYDGMQVTLPL